MRVEAITRQRDVPATARGGAVREKGLCTAAEAHGMRPNCISRWEKAAGVQRDSVAREPPPRAGRADPPRYASAPRFRAPASGYSRSLPRTLDRTERLFESDREDALPRPVLGAARLRAVRPSPSARSARWEGAYRSTGECVVSACAPQRALRAAFEASIWGLSLSANRGTIP